MIRPSETRGKRKCQSRNRSRGENALESHQESIYPTGVREEDLSNRCSRHRQATSRAPSPWSPCPTRSRTVDSPRRHTQNIRHGTPFTFSPSVTPFHRGLIRSVDTPSLETSSASAQHDIQPLSDGMGEVEGAFFPIDGALRMGSAKGVINAALRASRHTTWSMVRFASDFNESGHAIPLPRFELKKKESFERSIYEGPQKTRSFQVMRALSRERLKDF